VQVDLVFDRADNALTVCEMKVFRQQSRRGDHRKHEAQDRTSAARWPVARGRTIQPVLVVRESRDLIDQRYFYRIIEAHELLSVGQ